MRRKGATPPLVCPTLDWYRLGPQPWLWCLNIWLQWPGVGWEGDHRPLGLIMYVKNKHPVLHLHTSTEKAKHVGLFGVSSIKLVDEKTVEGQTLKQTNTFPGM